MDTGLKKERKPNPYENANILSKLTFVYMFPVFKRTFSKGITEDDLSKPLDEHKSSILGEKLEGIWKEEFRKHKKTALHRALIRYFGSYFMLIGFIKLCDEAMLVLIMPFAIGRLVSYFEKGQIHLSDNDAYMAAGLIILGFLLALFLSHTTMMALMHITMKLRVSCSSLVYRKTLRLSRTAMGSTTVGQVVNLLSNDVSKFDNGFLLAHFLWIGPIQTAIGTYMIFRHIHIAAFFGIVFLLLFLPLQIWFGKRTSVLRLRTALRTDERVRLMNEIISGIQVIKMYCWEKPFSKLINLARKSEMKPIRSHAILIGMMYSFEIFISRAAIFLSFIGYVLLGGQITAEKVFGVTAIYNVIRPVITILFSISMSSVAEVNVSVLRIQKFLAMDERDVETQIPMFLNGNISEKKIEENGYRVEKLPKIELQKVSAKWSNDSTDDTLKNIDFTAEPDQISAIIGPVGSGKTSLFHVFLKELSLQQGKLEIQGRISYSSQEPWLFAESVRQNILFGSEYDEERYQKVIDACALKSDFELFPYGDRTSVGEQGKALSGGQKARINLARCIYKKADIYLLDDPLSAVDANVGKHLFERCIKGFLRGKICILITHQLQYLKSADKIVIMKDGEIEIQGTFEELQTSGLDFANLLKAFQNEEVEEKESKAKARQLSESGTEENYNEDDDEKGPSVEREHINSGTIKASVYLNFLKAGGGTFRMILLIMALIGSQIIANSGDFYVSHWVNVEAEFTEKKMKNETYENETLPRDTIIYTYASLIGALIVCSFGQTIFFFLFFVIVSRNIHQITFSRVIKATMRFFNTNPSGRILNKFSKDLGYIDEYIPPVLYDVSVIFLQLAGTLILSFIVDPWLLLPSMVLITLFYFLRLIYMKTSRSVKRIEGATRSPIYGHMTASMLGLTTIRAFSAEEMLIKEFDSHQDHHSGAWYLFIASNRTFAFWLDFISIVFIGTAILSILYFNNKIQGGDMGLVMTQYVDLLGSLQWGMRQWSELENSMVSVERLLEYKKVEKEPERQSPTKLPIDWPERGKVEFRDVSLKYGTDDLPVLKNLNFTINPTEKIGIVGRTGAGKSSTITALFQLYDIEGGIFIDDVDTTKLPLDLVRSRISIIPQEPVLFSGTMRKNLDPFDDYSDEVLWNALEQVELKEVIADLPSGLHSNVSEGGANFSIGQRQLVCLARALIRSNKILVLDEATANVDPHTDSLIQNTIRNKFANCTVITIAHRLHTVMDSDKILVMSAGTVRQYDHPYRLLLDHDGILYKLVQTTGRITAINLENIAKQSYESKKRD